MYKQIVYWVKQYGAGGTSDQRAVADFIECETTEAVRMLSNELIGLSQGKYSEENLDQLIGVKRRTLHNSYHEWAKLMLQWIASANKG